MAEVSKGGFVRSPPAALLFISRHCDATKSTLRASIFTRLAFPALSGLSAETSYGAA